MNDGTNAACQDVSTLQLHCRNSWAVHMKQSSVLAVGFSSSFVRSSSHPFPTSPSHRSFLGCEGKNNRWALSVPSS